MTISQQFAKIGMQTTPGKLTIEKEDAKLSIKQDSPKVNMKVDMPKVQIDQYECFAEAGLKNMADLTDEITGYAKQNVMKYMAKRSSDGDRMAAIENKSDVIAEIARSDMYDQTDFNMGIIPTSRPKITVTGGLEIEPEPTAQGVLNGVEYQVEPAKININYIRGKLDIYLSQKASIEFRYEPDKKIDIKI
jgi:hypothetical protein